MLRKVADVDQDDAMHDIYTIILYYYYYMLYGCIKLQDANPTYLNLKRRWQIALHGCK